MVTASSNHIELLGNPPLDDLRSILSETGHTVAVRGLDDAIAPAQLYVIDGGPQAERARQGCARLRCEQPEGYTPILFLAGDAKSSIASLGRGADASLTHPVNASELPVQVQALLRWKGRYD